MRTWYRIESQADPSVAELTIYDVIGTDPWTGEGVSAKQFVEDLRALPASVKTIRVHLNSPGGDFADSIAIANALREHPATVEVLIEALAASGGGIIAQGGTSIKIAENGLVMVHNPAALVYGEAKDLENMAAALGRMRGAMIRTVQNLIGSGLRLMNAPFIWMFKVYLRITNAISRQQELCADAWAVELAGLNRRDPDGERRRAASRRWSSPDIRR